MAPKIFLTGATGYIGGDVLHALTTAHPEYEIRCLVRSSDKAAQLGARFAHVQFVHGDLDDVALIEEESRKADVVLSCANSDHTASVQAMVKGLSAQKSTSPPPTLIHTTGVAICMYPDYEAKTFGEAVRPEIYDDGPNIDRVLAFPDAAFHRPADRIVQEGSSTIRTALVSPPNIYGRSRGLAGVRGICTNQLAKICIETGAAPTVSKGQVSWTYVHLHDVSDLFVTLAERALAGETDAAIFGPKAYFFVEDGEMVWAEAAKRVAQAAHDQGLVDSVKTQSLTMDECNNLAAFTGYIWAGNARSRAVRARQHLNWSPSRPKLPDAIPDVVKEEAERLGKVQHHAAAAAGKA